MNSSQIKLIAIIAMLIDHTGMALFPNVIWFRVIGRLAFPIFAYFITEGYFKTRDLKKYMIRLGLFAVISQYPYYLHRNNLLDLNIFFTLLLGLIAIKEHDKSNNIRIIWCYGLIAQALNTDYGLYGVFTIYIFYKYRNDFKTLVKKQVALNFYFLGVSSILCLTNGLNNTGTSLLNDIFQIGMQALSLFSLLIIKQYNGERGCNLKYIFYGFYPIHLIVLHIIKPFVNLIK